MQTFITLIQPYLDDLAAAVITVLVSLAIVGIRKIGGSVIALIEARLTDTQRSTLHKAATEAYAYAEIAFNGLGGAKKLEEAEKYVSNVLTAKGIDITPTEIQSAIHAAWIAAGGVVKPTDTAVPTTPSPDDVAKEAVETFKAKMAELMEQATTDITAKAAEQPQVTGSDAQ